VLLFGGGFVLGIVQALGYLPGASLNTLSLNHFARVISDPDFMRSFWLTLYFAGVSTAIAAGISIVAALLLASLAERSRVIHFIFQVPLTVPHLVIAIAVMFLLAPAGLFSRAAVGAGLIDGPSAFPLLINDAWGIGIMLTYVWKEVPFITLMILAVLRHTGKDLLEVGRTLKAGPWQRFRYITLPTILPALGAASLIVFAFTFGAFEVPFLLGQTYPMTLPVWAFKNYSDIDLMARPEGIATGVFIALVVMLAVLLAQTLTKALRRRDLL
jgi:putative spermidine/putrescine transport system permease protein